MTLMELRILVIKKALLKFNTIALAAKSLGISERTIYNFKKKYD